MGLQDTTTSTPPSNGVGWSEKAWLESKYGTSASQSKPTGQQNQSTVIQTREPQTFTITSRTPAKAASRATIHSLFPPITFKEPENNDYMASAKAVKDDRYKRTTIVDFSIPNWPGEDTRIYSRADIYVNGVFACYTSAVGGAKIDLYPGIYEITCKSSGYEDYRFMIKIKEDAFVDDPAYLNGIKPKQVVWQPITINLWITMERKGVANPWLKNINITSDPIGADVYYDNMYFGTTPTTIPVKTSGAHVELEHKGYHPVQTQIFTGVNVNKYVDGDTLHFELTPE